MLSATALPALLAAALFAMRFNILKRRNGMRARANQFFGAALVIAGLAALVAGPALSLPPIGFAVGLFLLVLIGLYETSDYTSFRYFGTPSHGGRRVGEGRPAHDHPAR